MVPQLEQPQPQVSYIMRFLVTVVYIIVAVFVLIGLAYLVTSDGCPSKNQCTESDQIIFAIVGVADFALGFIMLFVGMRGWLPGTKQTKV